MQTDGTTGVRRRLVLFDDRSRHVDRFGLLLTVTAGSIVILSLVDLVEPVTDAPAALGSVAASVLVASTLLLALRASGLARRWRRIADILVGLLVLSSAIIALSNAAAFGAETRLNPAPPIMVLLAAVAPVVVVHRLLQHRVITRGTLFGAISAYLLIPIAFFYAFLSVSIHQDPSFFGHPEATTSFMYYSLTSITTLGYGDLSAVSDLGRLLSTMEAVVGQVYLITFVALLVSLFAQQWRPAATPQDSIDD